MPFERNKKASNPSYGKSMSVENMEHQIQKENKKVLKLLDEKKIICRKRWWKVWKQKNS